MSFLSEFLPIIIYILLIIVLVIGIILGIRLIIAIGKVEKFVEDVNDKVQSLNGVFHIIDGATDKIVAITDRVVEGIMGVIHKIFNESKKKPKKIKEEKI